MSSTAAIDKEEPKCLCGVVKVTSGSIIIGIIEFLVICHTLIFAFSNYSAGEERYELWNPIFSKVVKYDYLLPFLIVQLIWLAGCIVLIVAVKVPSHWLILPHIVVQIIIIFGGTLMSVMAIYNMQSLTELTWELMAALTLMIIVTLSELYLTYVVYCAFRFLKKRKLAVASESVWLNQSSRRDGFESRAPSAMPTRMQIPAQLPPIELPRDMVPNRLQSVRSVEVPKSSDSRKSSSSISINKPSEDPSMV